jgi:hypothetical protein
MNEEERPKQKVVRRKHLSLVPPAAKAADPAALTPEERASLRNSKTFSKPQRKTLADIQRDFRFVRTTGEVLTTAPAYVPPSKTFERYPTELFLKITAGYQPVKVPTAKSVKFIPAGKKWLESGPDERIEYRALTFAPGQPQEIKTEHGVDFNVWPGLTAPAKRGNVTPWLDLLDFTLVNLTRPQQGYVKQWLAHAIAHPEVRPNTALVFFSVMEGNGKSIIGLVLQTILGKCYREITDLNLESQFNSWAVGTTLALLNETEPSKYDRRKQAARLRNWVTNETIEINEKHRVTYHVPNFVRYILTTNQPDAVTLSRYDRRLTIVEFPEQRLPAKLRRDLIAWLATSAAPGALRYWAEHFSLRGFDPKAEALWTEAKELMRQAGLDEVDGWAEDLAAGKLRDPYTVEVKTINRAGAVGRARVHPPLPDLITAADLRARFLSAFQPRPPSVQQVSTALRKAGIKVRHNNKHTLFVLRNWGQWRTAKPAAWNRYYEKWHHS